VRGFAPEGPAQRSGKIKVGHTLVQVGALARGGCSLPIDGLQRARAADGQALDLCSLIFVLCARLQVDGVAVRGLEARPRPTRTPRARPAR